MSDSSLMKRRREFSSESRSKAARRLFNSSLSDLSCLQACLRVFNSEALLVWILFDIVGFELLSGRAFTEKKISKLKLRT